MDRRRIFRFFVIPAAAGLAAVLVVSLATRPGAEPARPAAAEAVPVVVAKRAVPANARLAADDLEVRQVAADLAVPGTLAVPREAVGKRVVVSLAAGQPVLKSLLELPENRGGLSARIPPGYRALTFAVTDLTGLAGRLQVGDRVDVVAFTQGQGGGGPAGGGPARATLLLEGVQVLALGKAEEEAAAAGGGQSRPFPYSSVTVAVRPDEGVLLTLAQRRAEMQLLLRPAGDEGVRGRVTLTEDALR